MVVERYSSVLEVCQDWQKFSRRFKIAVFSPHRALSISFIKFIAEMGKNRPKVPHEDVYQRVNYLYQVKMMIVMEGRKGHNSVLLF